MAAVDRMVEIRVSQMVKRWKAFCREKIRVSDEAMGLLDDNAMQRRAIGGAVHGVASPRLALCSAVSDTQICLVHPQAAGHLAIRWWLCEAAAMAWMAWRRQAELDAICIRAVAVLCHGGLDRALGCWRSMAQDRTHFIQLTRHVIQACVRPCPLQPWPQP